MLVDHLCVVTAMLLCAPLSSGESETVPRVGKLEQRFRQFPNYFTETVRVSTGYHLSYPVLLEGKWVVARLLHSRTPYESPFPVPEQKPRSEAKFRSVGLVAIEVVSGKALQLTLPARRDKAVGNRVFTHFPFGNRVFTHFPLHPHVCGVEIWHPRAARNDPKHAPAYNVVLWEWDLKRNRVTRRGDWEALRTVASVIDLEKCSLQWDRTGKSSWNGRVDITDKETGNTATVLIPKSVRSRWRWMDDNLHEFGRRFAPADVSHAFIVCDSPDPKTSDEVRIFCIDPRQPGGRRWLLDKKRLRKALGGDPYRVVPVPNLFRPLKHLPIMAEGPRHHYKILVIDTSTSTGAVVRSFPYIDWPISFTPVASEDGKFLVDYDYDEDILPIFRLKSLENGKTLSEFHAAEYAGAYPFGITADLHLLAGGGNAIWAFNLRDNWSARQVFRLDKDDDRN